MSDRFEADLKKALKESTDKSLVGWEFTPSMRQAVLKRIAQEEEARPSVPGLRHPRAINPRHYMWVAVAAAAFVLAIGMKDLISPAGKYAEKAESPAPMSSAQNSSGAPSARSSASPSGSDSSMSEGAGSPTEERKDQAQPEMAIATTQAGQATAPPVAQAAPSRIFLQMPEGAALALNADPTTVESSGMVTALAAPVERLALVRIGANTAVRTRNSVQFFDPRGTMIWEQLLAEGAGPLMAWNGHVVTTAGRELVIFSAEGQVVRSLTLPGAPEALALSDDGRVAAVAGTRLVVYNGDKLQFQVDGASPTGLAFGPDGTLAAVLQESDGAYLQLFGRDGSRLARAKLKGWGMGIAFAAGGDVILVGGEAFHRSGQPLWQTPFPTQEIFTLGPDGPVVARDFDQTISLLRPADGVEVWTAQHAGRATLHTAISDAADLLAVLASTEDGAAVWVLDQAGGLRFAERLTIQPAGVAVEGRTLYLLMPGGVETRDLP